MTRSVCPTSTQDLLAYWLGELDEAAESRIDEHLFACAACSESLSTVVKLGAAIRNELLRGDFGFVLPASFIRRLKDAGLRVREYNLEPGACVNCTVTPGDDLVVAHMRAPLRDVRRLDLLIQDSVAGSMRANDVAFDPAADASAETSAASCCHNLDRPNVSSAWNAPALNDAAYCVRFVRLVVEPKPTRRK